MAVTLIHAIPYIMGIIVSLALIAYLFLQQEEISDSFKERLRQIKGNNTIKRANNKLEEQLNDIMGKMNSYLVKNQKEAITSNSSLSPTAKLCRTIITTIRNPYNNTSPIKMFTMVVIFMGIGVAAGAILTNPVMAVSYFMLSMIIPFSFVSITGQRRRLKQANAKLHLFSVHLPNYLDSDTFEDSLSRIKKNLASTSFEYKIVESTLSNMTDYNMKTEDAINFMREKIDAEDYENNYLDTVLQAELTGMSEHKRILRSILDNYSELIINNTRLVNFSYWLYLMYILAVIGLIVVMAVMRTSDIENYQLLLTLKGQAILLVAFVIISLMGLAIPKIADLINLKLYKADVKTIEDEDIYV